MGIDFQQRSELFRESFTYIRQSAADFPTFNTNHYGKLDGMADVLPKPTSHKIPMLITGHSRQSEEWIAEHGDGWMYYPQHAMQQAYTIANWRRLVAKFHTVDRPFMQPLYVILEKNDDFKPQPIQLGFRIGANYLAEYLGKQMQEIGVNHVAINLRFNHRDMTATLEQLATQVLPHFHTNKTVTTA